MHNAKVTSGDWKYALDWPGMGTHHDVCKQVMYGYSGVEGAGMMEWGGRGQDYYENYWWSTFEMFPYSWTLHLQGYQWYDPGNGVMDWTHDQTKYIPSKTGKRQLWTIILRKHTQYTLHSYIGVHNNVARTKRPLLCYTAGRLRPAHNTTIGPWGKSPLQHKLLSGLMIPCWPKNSSM